MNFLRESKVAEFELIIAVDEHVLKLDVKVSVFRLGVKGVKTACNLVEKVANH